MTERKVEIRISLNTQDIEEILRELAVTIEAIGRIQNCLKCMKAVEVKKP